MSNKQLYVALEIGCLECKEDTTIIGVFSSFGAAEKALKEYQLKHGEQRPGFSREILEAEIAKV